MAYRVLICDDDPDIVKALTIYLRPEGYELLTASNGREALDIVRREEVHLVLMDIMMPDMDGLQATSELRGGGDEASNIPVIFLTAKSEDTDMILGLNIGADDYITKPFNPLEVLARVRSQLRRYAMLGGMRQESPRSGCLRVGGIELNEERCEVTLDGDPVSLTPIEFNVLRFLMKSPGKVFTSAQIYEGAWGERALPGTESAVAVHIRHLREKLEITPSDPRHLKVVWGHGYKIE